MTYLQYKSSEMFSSTQLIRKSKQLFDKIEKHEIEKAIILRDGKPSFIMLDFEIYEMIMSDYEKLKKLESTLHKDFTQVDIPNDKLLEENILKDEKVNQVEKSNKNLETKLKTKEEKKSALLDKLDSIEGIIINDTNEKPDNLKEFWE